ncbi:MAG: ribonuclease P protein component [Phycisphaerales bacterium JB040]
MTNDGTTTGRFRRRDRLTHAREFQSVFDARLRKSRGPITVFARPNGLGHDRLGLSIGRRVGNAAVRARAKRLIREAFRLSGPERGESSAGGVDYVVSSRPHPGYADRSLKAGEVRGWLLDAIGACRREQAKRERGQGDV